MRTWAPVEEAAGLDDQIAHDPALVVQEEVDRLFRCRRRWRSPCTPRDLSGFATWESPFRPAPAAGGKLARSVPFTAPRDGSGQPKALRTWYPAGTKTARDIVYPRKRALELASITHETVPSIPDETTETELRTVALTPIAPTTLAAPKPQPSAKPVAVVAEAAPEMPRTASR